MCHFSTNEPIKQAPWGWGLLRSTCTLRRDEQYWSRLGDKRLRDVWMENDNYCLNRQGSRPSYLAHALTLSPLWPLTTFSCSVQHCLPAVRSVKTVKLLKSSLLMGLVSSRLIVCQVTYTSTPALHLQSCIKNKDFKQLVDPHQWNGSGQVAFFASVGLLNEGNY